MRVASCAWGTVAGSESFLATEYRYLSVFMGIFSVIIFVFLASVGGFSLDRQPCDYDPLQSCPSSIANALFSTVAFILGALTSTLSGYLGMRIATYANARTTLEARRGVGQAFIVAFRSGSVMGFLLAANGLLVLFLTILAFKLYFGEDWVGLYEAITGYGLGGSSVALFGRVGGGIYTKAADVGADLVGKIEQNIPEDDPRNPAVSGPDCVFSPVCDTILQWVLELRGHGCWSGADWVGIMRNGLRVDANKAPQSHIYRPAIESWKWG